MLSNVYPLTGFREASFPAYHRTTVDRRNDLAYDGLLITDRE